VPTATGQPLVSVVTPVHNGASYLKECVESVLAQTYANWEYVIVDNASTDATPDIVAQFVAADRRVRHLRFEDLVPLNENHNRAFRAIAPESEFCKVVQADDWLFPECIERMVGVGQTSDDVGIVSAYRLWQNHVDLVGLPYGTSVVNGREILAQSLTGGPYVTGAPTALLLRSRLVRKRDPFYLPQFEHADTEAAYWVMSRADFGLAHQVLTFARRQPGARMSWSDHISTYLPENIRFLRRYGPGVLEPAVYRRRLRLELRRYIWYHMRQCAKPSRLFEKEFYAVHRAEIRGIEEEGGPDRDVQAALLLVKAMLLRGGRAGAFALGDH
jgi:glycosyltransferase involved in cell wall biosynthesis